MTITTVLFHQPSLIDADKLLKELLSDRCWYAARKQPSVSLHDSVGLTVCERWRRQHRAAVVEAAVDGSLGYLHMHSPGRSEEEC